MMWLIRNSVPIRGLFFLTLLCASRYYNDVEIKVSVPIRGIIFFNSSTNLKDFYLHSSCFRPHQEIIFFNPVFETAGIY